MARSIPFLCLVLACGNPAPAEPEPPEVTDTDTTAWTAPTDSAAPTSTDDRSWEGTNVLLIVSDDQGVDKVGVYDEHWVPPPTPTIDSLADDGVLFRNAWAYPVCSPSRAALLTGRFGRRNGLGEVIHPHKSSDQLRTSEVAIPRALAGAGYHSEALGKWHLSGYTSEDGSAHPLAVGFAHHSGSIGNLGDTFGPNPPTHYYDWEKSVDGELSFVQTFATTDTADDAIERIAEMPEPWFLYVAFNAPHGPLSAAPEELHSYDLAGEPSKAELYGALVESMDTEIRRILDSMSPELRARTNIVFTSDNGTPDFAVIEPWRRDHAKDSPFEGGVRVPLIVSGPVVKEPGREIEGFVHLVDLFPTFAQLAGLGAPDLRDDAGEPLVLDGTSLVPFLRDPAHVSDRTYTYAEKFGPVGAPPYNHDWQILRDERWKLIRGYGEERLYDMLGDPHPDDGFEGMNLLENPPLAEVHQQAYERLSSELDARLGAMAYESLDP